MNLTRLGGFISFLIPYGNFNYLKYSHSSATSLVNGNEEGSNPKFTTVYHFLFNRVEKLEVPLSITVLRRRHMIN